MGFERRIARRSLLRLSGGALLTTTVAALFGTPTRVQAEPVALRSSWTLTEADLRVTPLTSPPLLCDFPFNALESRWDATMPPGSVLSLAVRTSADGTTWTDWLPLTPDTHARDGEPDGPIFGDLQIVGNAVYAQYRVDAMPGMRGAAPNLRAFTLTAVNTRIAAGLSEDVSVRAEAFDGTNIIPRSGWNADENLRFGTDDKTKMRIELWTPEYRPIQKVVIHHTVTRDPETDAKATLRAIYQYHAVMRGWGDIGYNFLIDQQGNVYEGRFGGKGVVGGHTLGYNYGSIGIAVLGTYQDHTIPDTTRASLIALIHAKAGDLDPTGQGFFVDRSCPNINGHRGLVNSSCPGDAFYPLLNNLRRSLKGLPAWTGDPAKDPIAANPPDVIPKPTSDSATTTTTSGSGSAPSPAPTPKAQLTGVQWSTTSTYSRDIITAKVTVKNTGTLAFPAQDPPPTTLYTEGDTTLSRGFPGNKGSLRIAIGPDANGADPPFRWGLGRTLNPGDSATVTVPFRFTQVQRTRYAVSLIYEGYGILDHEDPVPLNVSLNPTEPTDAIKEANNLFFADTKHNMAPEFKDYWNANGGVFQFGFPVTEAYVDMNPDDGHSYTVQYFERARFEAHPEQTDKRFAVQLGRLGVIVTANRTGEKPFARVDKVDDTGDRRYFAETGHTLSGAFKTYWEGHGGLPIYGFPLCEEFAEKSATDGKTYTVQYFERNRFEYHPENKGTPQEVLLGLLGSEVLRRRGWLT